LSFQLIHFFLHSFLVLITKNFFGAPRNFHLSLHKHTRILFGF
jgi:hypothetical protein